LPTLASPVAELLRKTGQSIVSPKHPPTQRSVTEFTEKIRNLR
jgi:hypothetical protein